ncbi:MAG: peptidyl-prolyl cis-trans isomerase [Nitrospirota bacterium]
MAVSSQKPLVKSQESNPPSPPFSKEGMGGLLLYALCFLLCFVGGCASLQKGNILAVVDGEPITEEDLKYSLQITHRREDLSSASALNLSQYVQRMIDDRLITDEARRMGIDQDPEVRQSIQAYILRESVVRLHDEEIVKKVSVSEKDVLDYYKKNYEQFTLGLIEVSSEEEAKDILKQLKIGEDFKELARKYSTHISKKDGGEIVLKRISMPTYINGAVSNLKPGQLCDVIKIANKYYIIKLIDRKEAPDEELEKVRGSIEREIRKQKEKERSDEYLKCLRERAAIKINRELLSAIKVGGESEEIKKDKMPLAEVNGSILTAEDFVAMVTPGTRKSSEDILNNWIDRKLVDHEALSRHYENEPNLKKMLYRYENQLLKNTFIKRIVIPKVMISDKTLEDYYSKHQKSFIRPATYRIQQITVKTMDEAQNILSNLQNGADFSWVAKRMSIDSAGSKGGDIGWLTSAELPVPLREIIVTLKPGDISPVIKIDSRYRIVRLQGKTEEEVEEFNKVKNDVYRACYAEQINNLYSEYVNQLKKEAMIEIYENEIRSLEEKLQKK